ncbi:MAG TPA: peptidylprolyl isomerase, partial [Leucothrix sp.]|nr:peptidylprolyl isomerase [Leucothrix sp.]
GASSVLSFEVTDELEGKAVGDIIEVPIDCNLLYGPRDENLVFTDRIENVPEEYREIGMTITMENEKGEPKNFIVTRMDDKTLTVDGNNPLCGREVIFKLEVLSVRDATDEEIALGGKVGDDPSLEDILDN